MALDNQKQNSSSIPTWLMLKDTQTFSSDKEAFVNKSIYSFLKLLSKIQAQDEIEPKKFKVNVLLQVLCTFFLIVMITISKSEAFIMIVFVYMLVILCFMKADQIAGILKISLVTALFTFIILLPAAIGGNSYSLIMITAKVFLTITAVNIISHSEKWGRITGALKTLHIPDLFILVIDIAMKYIYLLGDIALNLLYAMKLRSVGINRNKYTTLAGIAGTVFIKSGEMAEEMVSAMKCRGFTGEYTIKRESKFTVVDLVYILINLSIALSFIYFYKY